MQYLVSQQLFSVCLSFSIVFCLPLQTKIHYYHLFGCTKWSIFGQQEHFRADFSVHLMSTSLEHFFIFWHKKISKFILHFLCCSPEINNFSLEPWFILVVDCVYDMMVFILGGAVMLGVPLGLLLLTPLSAWM